jgi:hypothetical protein
MNTVLSTRVDEQEQQRQHPPSWLHHTSARSRVSVADRVALHLGLALVTWSRRPRGVTGQPSWETLRVRRAATVERVDRERRAARSLHSTLPRR